MGYHMPIVRQGQNILTHYAGMCAGRDHMIIWHHMVNDMIL